MLEKTPYSTPKGIYKCIGCGDWKHSDPALGRTTCHCPQQNLKGSYEPCAYCQGLIHESHGKFCTDRCLENYINKIIIIS